MTQSIPVQVLWSCNNIPICRTYQVPVLSLLEEAPPVLRDAWYDLNQHPLAHQTRTPAIGDIFLLQATTQEESGTDSKVKTRFFEIASEGFRELHPLQRPPDMHRIGVPWHPSMTNPASGVEKRPPKPSPIVFVFGSNLLGIHGAGAALEAYRVHGAKQGIGEGHTGNAYAIPTKKTPYIRMTLDEIAPGVDRFIAYAKAHPELHFQVTPIGCGLAGHTPKTMAPLFRKAQDAPNITLPIQFANAFLDELPTRT